MMLQVHQSHHLPHRRARQKGPAQQVQQLEVLLLVMLPCHPRNHHSRCCRHSEPVQLLALPSVPQARRWLLEGQLLLSPRCRRCLRCLRWHRQKGCWKHRRQRCRYRRGCWSHRLQHRRGTTILQLHQRRHLPRRARQKGPEQQVQEPQDLLLETWLPHPRNHRSRCCQHSEPVQPLALPSVPQVRLLAPRHQWGQQQQEEQQGQLSWRFPMHLSCWLRSSG
mmetsp:Transcript_177178/g.568171  ORF Transcript_177178/g.568171 Transcript_177178/m.568171 type:complete len:222 (-) Transcript_177178:2775-3440(-)